MIKFGTAGYRWKDGMVNEDFLLHLLKKSIEQFLLKKKRLFQKQSVLVAYDHRPKSKTFAYELSKSKWNLWPEIITTPMLCDQCEKTKSWGIMLTASHNPIGDYGVKLIAPNGRIIESKDVALINKILAKNQCKFQSRLYEFFPASNFTGEGFVFYAMNGAGKGLAKKIFGDAVDEIYDECGSYEPKPSSLKKIVDNYKKTHKEFVMFCFDGDGDRLVVNIDGEFLTPSETLLLLAHSFSRVPRIISTGNMSDIIQSFCAANQISHTITDIGYQHIGPLLKGKSIILCGEESGGYCLYPHTKDRDGMYAAMRLMIRTVPELKLLLSQIREKFGRRYYSRIDVPNHISEKTQYGLLDSLNKYIGSYELESSAFGNRFVCSKGWIMFRRSGTESLTRIYFELTEPKTRLVESAILKYFSKEK